MSFGNASSIFNHKLWGSSSWTSLSSELGQDTTTPKKNVTVMLMGHLGSYHQHMWKGEAVFPGETKSMPVIAKLAFTPEDIQYLSQEARVYEYLCQKIADEPSTVPLPDFYGIFECSFNNDEHVARLLLLSYVSGTNSDLTQFLTAL